LHWASAVHAHWDAWQAKPGGHAWPQAPQLEGVLVRSTQPEGVWQHVSGALQAAAPLHEHASIPALTHTSPGLHAAPLHWQRPPAPQVPDAAPRLHAASTAQPQVLGAPAPHTRGWAAAPCEPHAFAQLPQAFAFMLTFVSQPSSAVGARGALQFAKPSAQVAAQRPRLQSSEATFVVAQARPHAPQFSGSDVVLASQPVLGF
jgi:hypothetical protein